MSLVALGVLVAALLFYAVARALRVRRGALVAPPPWVSPLRTALDQTDSWPCAACRGGRVPLESAGTTGREELDHAHRSVRRSFGAVCPRCGATYHVVLRARGSSPVVVEAEMDRVDVGA